MAEPDAAPGVRTFIIECYVEGAGQAQVEAADVRAREATASLRGAGRPVEYLGAVFVPADETAFYLFGARDVTAVLEAGGRAALPGSRVVESIVIGGGAWLGATVIGA